MIRQVLITNLNGVIHFSHYIVPLPPNEQGSINREITNICLEKSTPALLHLVQHFHYQDWYVYYQRSGVFTFVILVEAMETSLMETFLNSFTEFVVHFAKISTEKKLQNEASKIHDILAKMVSHGGRVLELRRSHVFPLSDQSSSSTTEN